MLRGLFALWIAAVFFLRSVSSDGGEDDEPKEDEKCCTSPNVRTVIFRQTDVDKECWSREEIALLFTRRMMQELLPKRKPIAISLLLEYFKECLETVKKLATSRKTHTLVVTALADTLGGYLQAFGLPLAHNAFYEGTMGYCGARQLHDLMDAFKKLLRTDGGGWTKPIKVRKSCKITPLHLGKAPSGIDPCCNLITRKEISCDSTEVEVLMPFLDDPTCPIAIALPFRDKNLYSLSSKCCANILVKYYSRTIWCLTQTYGTASLPECGPSNVPQVQCFFTSFYKWLNDYVVPRLKEQTFYPAFGSVYRIIETIKAKVKDSRPINEKVCNRPEYPIPVLELLEETACNDNCETSRRFYIIVIASLVLAFWIIVLIVYILYRSFCKKKKKSRESLDNSSVTSTECTSEPASTNSDSESLRSEKQTKTTSKSWSKRKKK